ncbi:hypothetical protein [Aquisalimonas asiatica]|uniref:Membrane-bound lysozyme-inhibitor of c-type lysozyme n=1 Tax=Aquisalimonas asiatica TaxID=406100 RepID=A0A1H8QLM6_9GAMM|nr:hypothetical protein [Aquisalimonas asiatica]SEO54918.1 hypothetical protein SAMN04488052_101643 [Aquisalimonas asiatica]
MNKFHGAGRALRLAVIVVLVLWASGCARHDGDPDRVDAREAPEPAPGAPGVLVNVFDCADGERVVTRGREGERLIAHRDGDTWDMLAVDDAETTYESDDGAVWQRDGAQAQWTGPEGGQVRCGETPGAVVWEEARLRGVDYRAEAGDQSWELELDGDTLSFRHRSRDGVLRVDDAEWRDDRGRLDGGDPETGIALERLDMPCDHGDGVDTLEQVRITVEGRPLQGCGGFLDEDLAP